MSKKLVGFWLAIAMFSSGFAAPEELPSPDVGSKAFIRDVSSQFKALDTSYDLTMLMGMTILIPLPGSEVEGSKQLNLEIVPVSPPIGAAPGLMP